MSINNGLYSIMLSYEWWTISQLVRHLSPAMKMCTPDIITINTHLKTNTPLNNCITNKDQYSSQLNNSAPIL